MVLPGHLAGGYLATSAILSLIPLTLSPTETTSLLIIGTLAGELPDIDLAIFYLISRKKKPQKGDTHRKFLTHIPLFWLLIFIPIALIGFIFKSPFIVIMALIIFAGTLTHLIFDSIDYGIQWLKPFSEKRFALYPYVPEDTQSLTISQTFIYYFKYIKNDYFKQKTSLIELIVTLIALIVFFV